MQVLVALVAIAAGAYFVFREFTEAGVEFDVPRRAATTDPSTGSGTAHEVAQGSDRILTCTAPDGSIFYTNAARCEDADLDNRLNVVPSGVPDEQPRRECLSADPDFEQRHQFLAACREDFFQALRLEKFLSRAPDPAASRRAREYCDLIARGVTKGCPATSTVFCYLPVCQQLAAADSDR